MPGSKKPAARGGDLEELPVPVVPGYIKGTPLPSVHSGGAVPDLCLHIIDAAYAAIDAPQKWTAVAMQFAQLLGTESATILIEDAMRPEAILVGTTSIECTGEYLATYRAIDPFAEDHVTAKTRHTRHCHLSHELVDDRTLRESLFYTDYWRRYGNLFWACGGHYELEDRVSANVVAVRDKAYGSFEEHERQLANIVLPHILRAAQLSMRLRNLHFDVARQTGIVDNLLDAVIVLDATDRIMHRNARARLLFNGVQESYFSARMLRLDGTQEHHRFHDALAQARGDGRPQLLSLRRTPPAPHLNLAILPDSGDLGGVQIFLRDPHWPNPLSSEMLASVFGFTPAQAEICLHLLRDESPENIAGQLGVTVNTVRTQIKAAMQRAGVHRIAQLVHQLASALPAAEATHFLAPGSPSAHKAR